MKLGEYQTLFCVKQVDFGVYLAEEPGADERVLLPARQVPDGFSVGDSLSVFLYKDSADRPIATTNRPKLTLGALAHLFVKEVTKIGAFLDWGLEKDLFLPYKEMTGKVQAKDEVLVTLYLDKSERLCASMRGIYRLLRTDSPYQTGDPVHGRIYEFSESFGTYVAVDDVFSARIAPYEDTSAFRVGDVIEAKVASVKADGKLDLTMREKAYRQMDADAEKVWALIKSYGGVLPFTEDASPEVIRRECGLSKNAFKRAVGRLYKEKKITIVSGKIKENV